MAHARPNGNNGNMVLGGSGDSTVTLGHELKRADTPIETLLGFSNGVITGGIVSSIISAGVTAAREGSANLIQNTARNIIGSHLVGVLVGTTAIATVSAAVRFSRARMHNQWVDEHYQFLERQNGGYAGKVTASREQAENADIAR